MTRALLLAAGQGSRLPRSHSGPKCLLSFSGHRLVDYLLEAIRLNGVERIAIVGGFQVESLLSLRLPTFVNREYAGTNMVWTLRQAQSWFSADEDLIISYTDIIYEPDVLGRLMRSDGDFCVVSDRSWYKLWSQRMSNVWDDVESFRADQRGLIFDIGRKPSGLGDVQGQYIGLVKLTPRAQSSLLEILTDPDPHTAEWMRTASMTDLLGRLIGSGWDLTAISIRGGWLEFDTPSDVEAYERLADEGRIGCLFDTSWKGAQRRTNSWDQ